MRWRATHWAVIEPAELRQAAYVALANAWHWHITPKALFPERKP